MTSHNGSRYQERRIKRLPAYKEARRIALSGEKRYLVFVGGRGSGKSWEMANIFVDKCLRDKNRRVLAFRKVGRSTKSSVFKQTLDVLSHLGIRGQCRVNQHEGFIVYPNGAEFLTAGLDDPDKVKSYAGLTDAWFEEAFETTETDFTTIDLGIRGEAANDATIGLTLNPMSWRSWIYERFFQETDPDAYVLKTTYRDNPLAGSEFGRIIEKIKDPHARKVLIDGEWGEDVKGLIYPDWQEAEELPDRGKHAFGLDFGYNDPMALVELRLVDQEQLYVKERLYQSEMTTGDLIAWMDANGIPKNALIVADAAEPDRIEEIYRAGYRGIVPANKGQGSVNAGISVVQGLEVFLVDGSKNVDTERRFYKWALDKYEKPLDKPIDEWNHAMDAIRYGAVHLATEDEFTGSWGSVSL